MLLPMKDNRRSKRFELPGVFDGEVSVLQPLRITQLSREGMQVETDFALQLDSLHEFRVKWHGQSVVLKGRVVHSRISNVDREAVSYVSGIEFVELSDRVSAAIIAFLAVVEDDRSAISPKRKR